MSDSLNASKMTFLEINFSDSLFDSIRRDYLDFDVWHQRAIESADKRSAYVVESGSGQYVGIAVLKIGEGPSGPSPDGLKISTFKVARGWEGRGIADLLISGIFECAFAISANVVFVTVLPGHEDVVRYFELRGFRRAPIKTSNGELAYIADTGNPNVIYTHLNRLAYDVLAEEYGNRLLKPGPNQEAPTYLADLLTKHLNLPIHRLLELGPGPGDVLSILAQKASDTVAIELSPKMAELARQRSPSSLIIVGDALEIDFSDHSFDGIYAGAFLHLFPEQEATRMLIRATRWLKPDGAIFINTSVSLQSSAAVEVKSDYVLRVARFRSRWTDEQFRKMINKAGLKIIDRATTDERERSKFWVAYVCKMKTVE